jgi:hypothetical protein
MYSDTCTCADCALIRSRRNPDRHVVLAAMAGGQHVQVGGAGTLDGAHALFNILDGDQSGFKRTDLGALYMGAGRLHSIHGEPVRFYRVRESSAIKLSQEFGFVERVPVGHVRKGR